jgi:hypothetical protein
LIFLFVSENGVNFIISLWNENIVVLDLYMIILNRKKKMILCILPLLCGIFLNLNTIMTNHILQWNCRSVKANFEELNLLINEKRPVAVCLQETFLKDSDRFSLKYHSCYSEHCSGDIEWK